MGKTEFYPIGRNSYPLVLGNSAIIPLSITASVNVRPWVARNPPCREKHSNGHRRCRASPATRAIHFGPSYDS